MREDEHLEEEIREAEEALAGEKNKRLVEYETQKSGMVHASCKSLKSAQREAENMENKLMRANQKLNQLSSANHGLRERINQLRKEKGAMENIYHKLKA